MILYVLVCFSLFIVVEAILLTVDGWISLLMVCSQPLPYVLIVNDMNVLDGWIISYRNPNSL